MKLYALLPANIAATSFDNLAEALNMYLPLMANDDGDPDIDDLQADFVR